MALRRYVFACMTSATGWILCEAGFGGLFLALGVRLWRYDVVPLLSGITSPVVWVVSALLVTPLMTAWEKAFRLWDTTAARRAAMRLAALMLFGSSLEVVFNTILFPWLFGRPLYRYEVLPTFGGSGSLLSPIYYATLYIHLPVVDRILGRQPSAARTSSSPETSRERVAEISGAA
jgi:hypothetical protein